MKRTTLTSDQEFKVAEACELHVTVRHALIFATGAHAGQYRKYSGDDYIVHPIQVCAALIDDGYIWCNNILAAAILHDTIEDTGVTYQHILDIFGFAVAEIVLGVTNVSVKGEGTREDRVKLNLDFNKAQSAAAQTLKVADIYANISDIHNAELKYANMYLNEKKVAVEALSKASPKLRKKTADMIALELSRAKMKLLKKDTDTLYSNTPTNLFDWKN